MVGVKYTSLCVMLRYVTVAAVAQWRYHYLSPTVVLGGHGVTCSPRDPRFTGSNPAEVDGFLGRKNPEHKSSEKDFKLGGPESEISGSLKNLKPEKIGL